MTNQPPLYIQQLPGILAIYFLQHLVNERSIRLYLALKELVEEEHFDFYTIQYGFVTVRCDIDKLLEHWNSEYACLGYGEELYQALIDFCEMTGIRAVLP